MTQEDIQFECEVYVSEWRVSKIARKAIGSPYVIAEPVRDIKLALKSIGVVDEVDVKKFEGKRLIVAPKSGVTVERLNEIIRTISDKLGSKISVPILIEGVIFALIVVGFLWGLIWVGEWIYSKQ